MDEPIPAPAVGQDLEDLLKAARHGRPDALGQLLQGYRLYLLRIAHSAVPAGLVAKASSSDVVQDTLLRALANFADFRGETLAELQCWLRTILLNEVGRLTRRYQATDKRQVDREVALPAPGAAGDLVADQPSPSQRVSREELAGLVQEVLDRLPEHYRQILVWREWDELSFKEIGQRLNRSEDAARMLWWRAIERFNREMGDPA
jgi:RNA polymerase sigma-70 factor (ECF subfamily)